MLGVLDHKLIWREITKALIEIRGNSAFWTYYRQYGSFVESGRKFRIADQTAGTVRICWARSVYRHESTKRLLLSTVAAILESEYPIVEIAKFREVGLIGNLEVIVNVPQLGPEINSSEPRSRSGITPRDLAACSCFAPYFKSNEVWALF